MQGKELRKLEAELWRAADQLRANAVELLQDLKEEKLRVDLWWDKPLTAAAVFNTVSNTLFETLPYRTYKGEEIDLRTNLIYTHLKNNYFEGGNSVYGKF